MAPKSQPKSKGQAQQELKQEDIVALQESLVKRLIQTGEWDRISAILKDRLAESGWTDETFHQAKEHTRQQNPLHFPTLMADLVSKAEANVPNPVKLEILELIRSFVDQNTSG